MKTTGVWALCCVAAGCATPQRGDVAQVVVEPPASWQSRGATPGEVDKDWWRKLGDPELTRVITRALQHNHDLRAAQARLVAAAAQARLAGAEFWPTLDLGGSGNRTRSVFVGLPSGFAPGGGPLTNTFNSYGVNLNAAWEIDLWGRIGAATDAATAERQASVADLRGLRQSIAAQTAKAWFAAVEARQQVDLASRTVASYQATENQVEDRFRGGVRPALDLRLARSRRMSAQAQLQLWEERYARATRQLQILQGRYPDGDMAVPVELPEATAPIPSGLPAEIVRRRPDLVAAERRLAAAGYHVDEAQASLYPRLSLSGQVGTTSDSVSDLLDLDFLIFTAAGNLLAPIVDGGRLREGVQIAVAREDEAIAGFAQAALRAYGEVETLLAVDGHVRDQLASLTAAATEASAARDLSEDRYRRGLSDFIAVLESQRNALAIDGQLISTRRLLLDLRVDLHLALGGGFEANPQPNPQPSPQPSPQPTK